jgi:hypothetical protein
MDTSSHSELPGFLDFCKSLDVAIVQTPEQAVELFRTHDHTDRSPQNRGDLGRDLLEFRRQIVASGERLLNLEELDEEKAVRRGEKSCMD